MQIVKNSTGPRINPAELRYLREALAKVTTGCKLVAMQAIVAFAFLHDGMDLTGEAQYLTAEMEASSQPHLSSATL
jgi:hypothetical protein